MDGTNHALTTKAIAAELNVTEQTVRQYESEGLIPCTRTLKGHRRFDLGEVRAALRLARPRPIEPLGVDETAPRLSEGSGLQPIRRVRRWQAQSVHSILAESDGLLSQREGGGNTVLDIPFVDVPGSSRFIAGATTRS